MRLLLNIDSLILSIETSSRATRRSQVSTNAVILAYLLAGIGLAMAIYLTLVP